MMWCASARRQSQLPRCPSRSLVLPLNQSALSVTWAYTSPPPMYTQNRVMLFRWTATTSTRIRRYVTNDCFRSLDVSLVHSRLDYGNFMFVGLPAYLQRRLQAVPVLNAAARLVFRLFVAMITSLTPSRYYTGCVCRNESISSWR